MRMYKRMNKEEYDNTRVKKRNKDEAFEDNWIKNTGVDELLGDRLKMYSEMARLEDQKKMQVKFVDGTHKDSKAFKNHHLSNFRNTGSFPINDISSDNNKTKTTTLNSFASHRLSTGYLNHFTSNLSPAHVMNSYTGAIQINEKLKNTSKEKMYKIMVRTRSVVGPDVRQTQQTEPTKDISNLFENKTEKKLSSNKIGLKKSGEPFSKTFYSEKQGKKRDDYPNIMIKEFDSSNTDILSNTRNQKSEKIALNNAQLESNLSNINFMKPFTSSQVHLLNEFHTTDFYKYSLNYSYLKMENKDLIYSLFKEIPNCLQNYPTNKQEALKLKDWFFKGYDTSKDKESKEEYCQLALLETLRQVTLHYSERGNLMMEILERYFSIQDDKVKEEIRKNNELSENFDNDFKSFKKNHQDLFNRTLHNMQDIQLKLKRSVDELERVNTELSEKDSIVFKLNNKCSYFQSAALKFKNSTLKYYQLVTELRDMIRSEKKWTSKDFEDNLKLMKDRKMNRGAAIIRSTTSNRPTPKEGGTLESNIGDIFHLGESEEDSMEEAGFEAKKIRDAEDKVIEKIFGGNQEDLHFNMFINESGLLNKDMRKYDKCIQTEEEHRTVGCQSDISVVDQKYDQIFVSNQYLDQIVAEIEFKKKLLINVDEKGILDTDMDEHQLKDRVLQKVQKVIDDSRVEEVSMMNKDKMIQGLTLKRGLSDFQIEKKEGVKLPTLNLNLIQKEDISEGRNGIVPSIGNRLRPHLQNIKHFKSSEDIGSSMNVFGSYENNIISRTVTDNEEGLMDMIRSIRDNKRDVKDNLVTIDNELSPMVQKSESDNIPLTQVQNISPKKPVKPKISVFLLPPPDDQTIIDNPSTVEINRPDEEDNMSMLQNPIGIPKMGAGDQELANSNQLLSPQTVHSSNRREISRFNSKYAGTNQEMGSQFPSLSEINQMYGNRDTGDIMKTGSVTSESNSKHTMMTMLQQLTYEINKNEVVDKKLMISEARAREQEREIDELRRELEIMKDHFLDVEKKMRGMVQDKHRLKDGGSVRADDEAEIDITSRSRSSNNNKGKGKSKKIEKTQKKKQLEINNHIKNFNLGVVNYKSRENNKARELISLLNRGNFARFKNPMALRTIMKTINTLFSDRMKDISKPELRIMPFPEYVYIYYTQAFGKDIAEKRFTFFILSLKYYAQYFRVNLFSRFMGLIEQHKYDEDIINKYFEGVDFLENYNQKGFQVRNKDTAVRVLQPYIRADEYTKLLFEEKLSVKDLQEYRKSLEKLKEPDPSGMNVALVDQDLFMETTIHKYSMIVNRTKQYVIDAFKACDLDGNNCISVNEFLLLNRYIEPKDFDMSTCVKHFFDNVDNISENEQTMSFDKFAIVCTNLNIFTETKQNQFLEIESSDGLKMVYQNIKKGWDTNYHYLLGLLNSFEKLTPEEMEEWRNILLEINQRMGLEKAQDLKSTIMAYKITKKELERIQVEEEEDDEDDHDLSKAITSRRKESTDRSAIGVSRNHTEFMQGSALRK